MKNIMAIVFVTSLLSFSAIQATERGKATTPLCSPQLQSKCEAEKKIGDDAVKKFETLHKCTCPMASSK